MDGAMIKFTQERLDDVFYRIKENTDLFRELYSRYVLAYINLSGLDFRDYDLRNFTLEGSNLKGADLSNTILGPKTVFDHAIFDENTKMPFVQSVCPEEGSFIGYKKALDRISTRACIVKLLIPEDAKRSSGLGAKCRCNKAKVLDIESMTDVSEAVSLYDRDFVYRIGEMIEVKDFDECRWHLCAPGIHFYIDPALAILH